MYLIFVKASAGIISHVLNHYVESKHVLHSF